MSTSSTPSSSPRRSAREWTADEHARYLEARAQFPNGPWKAIAAHVGTRNTRQVMTHYSKIALRLQRHARGLRPVGRPRIAKPCVPPPQRQTGRQAACKIRVESPVDIQMQTMTRSFVEMLYGAVPQLIVETVSVSDLLTSTTLDPPPSPVTPGSSTFGASVFGFYETEGGNLSDWDDLEEIARI